MGEVLLRVESEFIGEAVSLGNVLKETGVGWFRPIEIWKKKLSEGTLSP